MPPSPTTDLPFGATGLAAFVLAMLALFFLALWRREHEPGVSWLALGFGLLASWFSQSHRIPPAAATMQVGLWPWFALAGASTTCLAWGLLSYLGASAAWRRATLATVALAAATIASIPAGLAIPRTLAGGTLFLPLAVAAALAFRASRIERHAGHAVIGAALAAIPATFVLLSMFRPDTELIRYVGLLCVILFGLTVLTVSLVRRRHALLAEVARRAAAEDALARLNEDLERTVDRRTTELRELVAALEGFNRSVSHDLRGPLGGIAGLARMAHGALAKGDAAMALRALPAIAMQAETSTRLVAALLELARAGDAPVRLDRVALTPLADDVLAGLATAAPQAPRPRVIIEPMPAVRADENLLRPVLVNLIGNAVKFSREAAEPCVRVRADVSGDRVTVAVSDNGVGFPPEAAATLFQPFHRLHDGRFEGHGVGLSIVRRAIERQGGSVWAEGAPGEGATFKFSLPLAA